MDINQLETPALLVDLDRLTRNLERVAAYGARHGVAVRPHVKTHKSPALAREQLARGAAGLTCATAREAEVMSEVCDDLLVMYPPVGRGRAARLARLAERVHVSVALDSDAAARDMSVEAAAVGSSVRVLVELDAGMHRVGVQSVSDALDLARRVAAYPGLRFGGLAFYPGHVREHVSEQDARIADLRRLVLDARATFDRAGIPLDAVSAGSTPTLFRTHEIEGVTEMRPGTYIFNDRTTVAIGACAMDDCALTVLATVVSTAVPGQVVVDAGSKALGREPLRGSATASSDGFACLADDPSVVVTGMSEEHGILELGSAAWRPRVGDRVRLVPNHVCICVHLADVVYGVRDGAPVSSWPVAARGRGQPVLEGPSERALLGTNVGR